MHEREIRVHTDAGEMPAFVVRPDGDGPFPVAVLYMDAIGYREQLRENARRFPQAASTAWRPPSAAIFSMSNVSPSPKR